MNASTVSENTLTSKLRPVCQPEGICLKNHAVSPPAPSPHAGRGFFGVGAPPPHPPEKVSQTLFRQPAASPPYGGEALHHLLGRSMYQRTAPRMISGASPEIISCIVVPRLPILN